ncbi:aminoacyl-tRNA hydrolase [Nitrosophilus kaiyonis]|uniref:aminoacyl-tRNA hydrolase n=1 Tax=Nitrosophilus kaiyonis TaxID=2930200 RepID=UPI0024937D25|nr:aminoacyl-tRNA hydrolase [Nitrosophilus kaiyonis]
MFLVVGLGNPGPKYKNNRHNIGFMVVDYLVNHLNPIPISKKDFKGELYKLKDILLLKPSTFMNLSGESVKAVKNFYKIKNSNIIVIHDDLDLPFGAIRFKKGGSSGGHNGLKSIDNHIGNDYIRVRIGIGRPKDKSQVVNFVLNDFNEEEKKYLDDIIKKASLAVIELTKEDLDKVRSRFSQKGIVLKRNNVK